ncbi:hypothetical protein BL250_04870 [Erwinia sp. OLTSP20]|uniref:LPS biosynthesis-modulating metalloenzyme YejM n=1 Tax=unclassified Erwinia TaxID=2622719 RepID=UPI000C1899A0|nr:MULTISPECIES: LPS biosynthesis-modulating metalloenzyme YejM [unclassified Erwinia]PIJ49457.1 hypothetical protein BV501_12775 [Erwinia sp. OAMSP11]PIJ68988.1 hypothetical protein BK416_15655 [Erwinia sp. OLSSP12]PIJ80988.1 hypothetical protein BLD46_13570 [Erwinia sp. OLMTSP26]PIJ83391.1 hypothetical protein BLD49_13255 [Erwinia sp. OLMDSP33]PIJ84304.1 hypothetical protein BLD47_02890 [Erwinia sp. OLCASP19]
MVTNRQRYLEKISQMISWGHWFALFNIICAFILGSRYLILSDWPASLAGRIYAIASWIGQFSFIVFAAYLLIIFPLTFIVMSQRLMRFLSVVLATAGLTLLLVDSTVYNRFHLHLNPVVWELVINPDQSELARDWQLMFISVPVILLIEMLFATWSWQKLRSLNRLRFARPLVTLFICAFIISHVMYIWSDANFYRPVTMQRANLPLSYPMTARKFLERHGMLDASEFQRRLIQQGNPEAVSVNYPLNDLTYRDSGTRQNLLVITVDGLNAASFSKDMPQLNQFAGQNIQFTQHFSSGSDSDSGLFGLFYGISPGYMDSILASRTPSALIGALNHQGYQFAFFDSDGFTSPLYRQALLADFTLPPATQQSNSATGAQWQSWLNGLKPGSGPWFSYVALDATGDDSSSDTAAINHYKRTIGSVDDQIQQILSVLQQKQLLDNTVVVITGRHGLALNGDINPGNRALLQVPLVIHWPHTPPQTISRLTDHQDIMTTLMKRLLHVSLNPADYSQGEDLFAAQRYHKWIAGSEDRRLIVTTPDITILLDNDGSYEAWDNQGNKLKDHRPQLALLLQVLTEEKRFIAD